MATIRQIAEMAQVSTSTVSLALRDNSRISATTRTRIQALAERLHYRVAGGCPSRELGKGVIGCLVSYISITLYSRILSGILQECFTQGRPTIVLEYGHHLDGDTYYAMQALIEQHIAGLLIIDSGQSLSPEAILDLRSHQIAAVLVGGQGSKLPIDIVTTDEQHLAASVIDYLLQLGHRHLLYLEPRHAGMITRRHHALQLQCAQRGVRMDYAQSDEMDAASTLRAILTRHPTPTALICFSDTQAMSLIHVAPTLNLHIPKQLSIMSCGNLYGSQTTYPALTTVDLYPEVLGRHAAQRLMTLLEQPSITHEPTVEYVPTCLHIRQSCSPAKSTSATALTENMSDATTHPAVAAFLNLVRQGLTEARIYVTDKTGGLPMRPELWGWRQLKTQAPWQPSDTGIELGYLDGPWLMLYPRRLSEYIGHIGETTGASFPCSLSQLKRLLAEAGLIDVLHENARRRYTVVVRHQQTVQRMLRVNVIALYPEWFFSA